MKWGGGGEMSSGGEKMSPKPVAAGSGMQTKFHSFAFTHRKVQSHCAFQGLWWKYWFSAKCAVDWATT